MTARGEALLAHARTLFACLAEHDPEEASTILFAIVMHLRSAAPLAMALDELGPPEAREPRPSNVRPVDAMRMFRGRVSAPVK